MQPAKTGYLNSDFRIFYLTNTEERDFQSHYHDFHKLLIFESGSLSYYIEGKTYQLQPWDIVLVPAGQVHRPVIHDTSPYRRLIIYLSPAYLEQFQNQVTELHHFFECCAKENSHVFRITKFRESRLYPVFQELRQSADEVRSIQFPSTISLDYLNLYQQTLLLQFLLLVSRLHTGDSIFYPKASDSNRPILQALTYINDHLQEDLSVERIADSCFLNRSYLMHLFRKETGYTILSYITEKRLFAARTMIQSGIPVTEACMRSGFQSYGAFYRAYRKKFGEPPKEAQYQ